MDDLLKEADECPTDAATPQARGLIFRLAQALREAEAASDKLGSIADEYAAKAASDRMQKMQAMRHLQAVLAQGWPMETTGPEVVRKARAFVAGQSIEDANQAVLAGHIEWARRQFAAIARIATKALGESCTTSADEADAITAVNRLVKEVEQLRKEAKAAARLTALLEAVKSALILRDEVDGNGGRLIAKPCSSGSCNGRVCGKAAWLQSRLDELEARAKEAAS